MTRCQRLDPRMTFDLTVPCSNCPFLRDKAAVRLHPTRAREIAEMMADPDGRSVFTCHSHCHSLGLPKAKAEKHCAGALIFMEKVHKWGGTPLMQIMGRLGFYDRAKLIASPAFPRVFSSVKEMVEVHRAGH